MSTRKGVNWTSAKCRCGGCAKKNKYNRFAPIGLKKRSLEQVTEYTKEFISTLEDRSRRNEYWKRFVTAEEISGHYKVRTHLVEQALHKLNLEGIVSKGLNSPPHDSRRDGWYGDDSSWSATRYMVLEKNNDSEQKSL